MDSLVDHRARMRGGMQADGLANGRDGVLVTGKGQGWGRHHRYRHWAKLG